MLYYVNTGTGVALGILGTSTMISFETTFSRWQKVLPKKKKWGDRKNWRPEKFDIIFFYQK